MAPGHRAGRRHVGYTAEYCEETGKLFLALPLCLNLFSLPKSAA